MIAGYDLELNAAFSKIGLSADLPFGKQMDISGIWVRKGIGL
jgi:hypothetical protein